MISSAPRVLPFLAAALLSLSASAAESAPTASIEDRLNRLEAEVSSLRAKNQELQNRLDQQAPRAPATAADSTSPAAASAVAIPSGILGAKAPPASTSVAVSAPAPAAVPAANTIVTRLPGRSPSLALGGFIHAQADFLDKGDSRFSSGNDRFYLRRARVIVAGRFNPEVDFRADVELAGSLGETTGYRGQLSEGFVNWTRYPAASLRLGQTKTPFGYEQLASDLVRPVIERSLPNDRLTVGRQIGAQLSGDFLNKRLRYSTGVFNGTSVNTNANDNDSFLYAGRVSGVLIQTHLGSQHLAWTAGTNLYTSKDAAVTANDFGFAGNIFSGQRTGVGIDTQLRIGRFDVWAEYLRARFKPTTQLPAGTFEADGWYTQLSYNFVPKYWQGAFRFETFDPNTSRAGNSSDNWIIGANYLFGGDAMAVMINYYLANPAGQPDHSEKIMLRLQTVF